MLKVFSGECQLCDAGIDAGANDSKGAPLHTGDIVLIYHGSYVGTDHEQWDLAGGLTAIVADQYESFSNGTAKLSAEPSPAYAMGIKACGLDSPNWDVVLLKKFSEVVDGENWKGYGFNYRSKGKEIAA
jgi:hypothetical protein